VVAKGCSTVFVVPDRGAAGASPRPTVHSLSQGDCGVTVLGGTSFHNQHYVLKFRLLIRDGRPRRSSRIIWRELKKTRCKHASTLTPRNKRRFSDCSAIYTNHSFLVNTCHLYYNGKCVSRRNPYCVATSLPSLPAGAPTPPGGTHLCLIEFSKCHSNTKKSPVKHKFIFF